MIDLHTHSTCSDGTFSPEELVREAKKAGVTHLALTDHDTVEGVEAAARTAREEGIAFLPGIEISAEFQPGTLHILGYGLDSRNETLRRRLDEVQRWRRERNPRIVERLNALGMDVTLEEVAGRAGGDLVGRPHFAQTLLDKGYVQSRQEAFDRFLAKGRPAYVDKVRLSPEESIALIRTAGGLPVLAHPLQLGIEDPDSLETFVRRLADLGLRGIECYYRNHTEEDEARFTSLARKYSLLPTGGSDFHGQNRPRIRLGTGEGNLQVPMECWEGLVDWLESEDVGK